MDIGTKTAHTTPSTHLNDEEISNRTIFLLDLSKPQKPRYCPVAFGDLHWKANTTYENLLSTACSSVVDLSDFVPNRIHQPNVLLIHQVPKTGSTAQRKILQRNRLDCPENDQHLPDTTCTRTPKLMQQCPQLGTFLYWTQANTNSKKRCFDYTQYDGLTHRQYLHAIPFRNFNDWARSALNQIAKRLVAENPHQLIVECNRLRRMFQLCLTGTRELSFRRYSKSILRFVLHETLSRDPVLLYNYANGGTNFVMGDLLRQLGQEPMELEFANSEHSNATCSNDILDEFHACFDREL